MPAAFEAALRASQEFLERVARLNTDYRAGNVHANVPAALQDTERPLDDIVKDCLPASHAALDAASQSLFFSLPLAFDPSHSVGPYLAVIDKDAHGEPYRFIDMGAQIATQAFGENDPAVVDATLRELPFAVNRYAHSEYQTVLSLRLKSGLDRIAPSGTPRHFVVNTGAEAVENAIKSALLNRVKLAGEADGGVIISFEGAFHGRTLGCLAVTHRKKARLGFPTFNWPHTSFPIDDPSSPLETAAREEQSLLRIWSIATTGTIANATRHREEFRRELDAIDAALANLPELDVSAFVLEQRRPIPTDVLKRARHVAAVLVEPIQGEGGVHMASARFFQRLRLLTRIYDIPLMFDEVQTGWGATGRLWAHELFDLPAPPDVVIWAKKAQNGVLFVSEELATFFQEEKKFNTTWEGEPIGMVRLLSLLDRLDLEQVRRTGAIARAGLEALAREAPGLLGGVRGAGVMLAFDVARADWRDVLRDRAFRRGLILLPAGERTLRFYPRYDTEPYAIAEALDILREAVRDLVHGDIAANTHLGPKFRIGAFECPLEAIETIDISAAAFEHLQAEIMNVEVERYGSIAQYPPDVLRAGRRPLLQYPLETLETTIGSPRAAGAALRDKVSGRVIAFALGSPLENFDEVGVLEDPRFGEGDTFYLQAAATLPTVRNQAEVATRLLDAIRVKITALGYAHLSTLIEADVLELGPTWLREARVLRVVENYLQSGVKFVYLHVPLSSA